MDPIQTSRVAALAAVALVATSLANVGCANSGGSLDPTLVSLRQLESVAVALEADAAKGGPKLATLSAALRARLTPAQASALAANVVGLLEATSAHTAWQPTPAFYAALDTLRDLPFVSEFPAPPEPKTTATKTSALAESVTEWPDELLATRTGALALGNAKPRCGQSCEAQATVYAAIDASLTKLTKWHADLVAGGIDCAQDTAKLGKCAMANTCTWDDLVLLAGGCGATTGELLLLAGVPELKGAAALIKLAASVWSMGSIAPAALSWIQDCRAFQAASCNVTLCPTGQKLCFATNGSASVCCPTAGSCLGCATCHQSCGAAGCCVLGQRCDGTTCTTCATGCGPSCCTAGEQCSNAATGLCVDCPTPCGLDCCAAGESCATANATCCPTARLCGATCCAEGQSCDAKTGTCKAPTTCDNAPAVNCVEVCHTAVQSALAQCAAKGGTWDKVPTSADCVGPCLCLAASVPSLGACFMNPACPGCASLESAVKQCGQMVAVCKYKVGGG